MQKNLTHYICLLCVFTLFFSCQKDEPTAAEPSNSSRTQLGFDTLKTKWQRYPSVTNDDFFGIQFFKENDKLSLFGQGFLNEIDTNHNLLKSTFFRYETGINYHTSDVFFSEKFTVMNTYYSGVEVQLRKNPNIRLIIDVRKIDSTYFTLNASGGNPCYITPNDELIMSVRVIKNKKESRQFCILQLTVDGTKIDYQVKKTINDDTDLMPITYLNVMKKMYVRENDPTGLYYFGSKINRLDLKTDEIKPVLSMNALEVIETKDTTWYLGFDNTGSHLRFVVNPKGSSIFIDFESSSTRGATSFAWHKINDKIVMVQNRNFVHNFTTDLKTKKVSFKSIKIDNLREINDIVEWNGRVYLATSFGIFYKPVDEFFEYID